jgi:hypothetical protein
MSEQLVGQGSRERVNATQEHLAAQAVAPEIYESFWVQDAETYREYTWKDGVHTDKDLASLFAETAQAPTLSLAAAA